MLLSGLSVKTVSHVSSLLQVMDRSKKEMIIFRSELNKAKKKNRELHSLRCDLAYKLNVSPAHTACNVSHTLRRLPGWHKPECMLHVVLHLVKRIAVTCK